MSTIFVRRPVVDANTGIDATVEEFGGKGRALAALSGRLPIPPWFVVTPAAFRASMSASLRDAMAAGSLSSGDLAGLLASAAVRTQLETAVAELCPHGEFVAVRSSAVDEDNERSSFAGQLDSYLFVAPELVAQRVADVWRSAFSERVMAYRRERGALNLTIAPAVIVQRMIDANVSGVAFSVDPVSSKADDAVVCAVYGLGSGLVSGDCDADTYRVDRGGHIVQRAVADKRVAHRALPGIGEGVTTQAVDQTLALQPALDDDGILRVAELARTSQAWFGVPQDIEWAMSGGELYLLQSRPITTLTPSAPERSSTIATAAGALNIWDNSNIAESYGGVTTPLTFSFARHAYEGAYRQFCRLMRIADTTIAAHDDTFRNMLGLIQGRVYYNLLNWYRVLALLPGYKLNKRFMEQMMGVKEPLPDGAMPAQPPASGWDRLRDGWHVLVVAAAFAAHYVTLPRRCDAFFAWLRETLADVRPDETNAPEELVASYRRLESRLIDRWDAPLINDLFAMIFFGLLRRLCERWCGDKEGTLQNGLVSGEGGMISAQPAALVTEMARVASRDPALVATLCAAPMDTIDSALRSSPQLQSLYTSYLDKFGDRATDELKLESPTLRDDPLMLVRSVGTLAQHFISTPEATDAAKDANTTLRQAAEERVAQALGAQPLRRAVFAWVLRNARRHIVARENLRFERTRLFGRVRAIFTALGHVFQHASVLARADDIFYLEVEEALGFVEGTATTRDLAALAATRRREFDAYRAAPAPPDRFETHGMIGTANVPHASTDGALHAAQDSERRTGLGCCPGVVRGQVRVVTDPRRSTLQAGEILVAECTDPGWVML
ncbi:MAG: phosphoenolpyruvate synthase, partial [Candidatus Eremiobacteraeota bacterium]|nr:phosphoenolpyruvate synthase [Candidatus Eremiobacteraeota bacterium]